MFELRAPPLALLGASALALVACSDGGEGSAPGECVRSPRTTTHAWPDLPGTTGPTTGLGNGELTAVSAFGENPGGLAMFVHAPPSLAGACAPIVVALHGCTQSASAYAAAGWNALADREGFVVVYPEQSSSNDIQRCFRWWDPAHTTRERGEAKSIMSMVESARSKYGAAGDVYVTGLSAGGAMTAVMLATYPDVFVAGAIMSGLPYHCATSKNDAYSCMSGKEKSLAHWSALLPPQVLANPPRVAIWHGTGDYVVRPTNATQLVRQWTAAHRLPEKPTVTERIGTAEHTTFHDASGAVAVELWRVEGMSHGVALDAKKGCGKAGAFMLDVALCSTSKAAEFFGLTSSSTSPGASGNPRSPGTGASGDCD